MIPPAAWLVKCSSPRVPASSRAKSPPTTYVDVPKLAREVIADIGFTDAAYGFDAKTCGVFNVIQAQSPDIAMGVDTGGAGDQGLMFGYACDETPELMPLPIMLAHKLARRLSEVRRSGELDFLRPDGKSQVSVEYVNGKPVRIDAVVISTQHHDTVSTEELREKVRKHVIDAVIPANMVDANTKYHINPTGRFVIGGPHGDTGLTGRKIIVDTYGGMGRHGGGAFSGKDPTKVDRSACYMARYIAKNIVAAGLASRCEVQLAYAIGVAEPVSVMVNTFGTGKMEESRHHRTGSQALPADAEGHHRSPEIASSDLSQNCRVRSFRPYGRQLHLGSRGQSGSTARRSSCRGCCSLNLPGRMRYRERSGRYISPDWFTMEYADVSARRDPQVANEIPEHAPH